MSLSDNREEIWTYGAIPGPGLGNPKILIYFSRDKS